MGYCSCNCSCDSVLCCPSPCKPEIHGSTGFLGTVPLWILFGVTAFLCLASLLGNILCYFRPVKKDPGAQIQRHVRTSSKSAEETPLYGNLSFLQSGLLPDGEKAAKLDTTGQHGPEHQMCYTNLKVTKPAAAQQMPDETIHYADVVMVVKEASDPMTQRKEARKKKRAHRVAAPTPTLQEDSLYASVQTDRFRTLFEEQDYANNN